MTWIITQQKILLLCVCQLLSQTSALILALNLVSCRALSLPGSAVVCLQLLASAVSKIYGVFSGIVGNCRHFF